MKVLKSQCLVTPWLSVLRDTRRSTQEYNSTTLPGVLKSYPPGGIRRYPLFFFIGNGPTPPGGNFVLKVPARTNVGEGTPFGGREAPVRTIS